MSENRAAPILVLWIAAITIALASLFFGNSASAQTDPYSGGTPGGKVIETEVKPKRLQRRDTRDAPRFEKGDHVAGIRLQQPAPRAGMLPFTGADLTLFAFSGFAAVVTGSYLLRRARSKA